MYSDGAGNFRSLSFEIMMAERAAALGIKILCRLLPEAGDGKDRCDRDFAGVKKLLQSWLTRMEASVQNAVEIVEALEYGKKPGDGVVNCAIAINKPDAAQGVNTTAFTRLVGKARDKIYYSEFEYEDGAGGELLLNGARFHAYYKIGAGVALDRAQLDSLWQNKPTIPQAQIIAGSQLGVTTAVKKPKVERSKENKAQHKAARQLRKKQKRVAIESAQQANEVGMAPRRTSKRCCTCDRGFMRGVNRDLHQAACVGKTTKAGREAAAIKSNTFDCMKGASVDNSHSNVLPVPQDGGYGDWITGEVCWGNWVAQITT